MRYGEFTALCVRKAQDGWDVIALTLDGPSAADLSGDVLANPDTFAFYVNHPNVPQGCAITAGAAVREVVNPATGSLVTITCGPGPETARVRHGDATVTVPVG